MPNLHGAPEQHASTDKYRAGEVPAAYVHQDYPKMLYNGNRSKSVKDEAEEQAAVAEGFISLAGKKAE